MTFRSFVEQMKVRHIRKTMAIYMSSAVSLIGIVRIFLDAYELPKVIFTILVSVLASGIGSAFVFGWYHGVEGAQKFTRKELSLHAVFALLAITLSYRVINTSPIRVGDADAKSIAVLPFRNMSDSREDEYFSDGIMEDILLQLSRIHDLQVISRTSAMQYRNTAKNLREIGQELNVGSILEGSVRRAGNRVRISGRLIDATEDRELWAETYDREMKDVFAIQSEVAQQIAGALKAKLSTDEINLIAKKPTENLDAYAFYLRGRDYFYRYTRDDNERAIELFQKALAIDSGYALAYAGLGDAYERRYYYDFPPSWVDSAAAVSRRALELDPNLAEGYKALGSALQTRGEVRAALDLYQKAVSLNPNYAAAVNNIGFVSWSLGSYDEAARWMRKASRLEPNVARWTANVGFYYLQLGLDSLTEVWLRKAMHLQPDYIPAYVWLAYHHAYGGRDDSARAYVQQALLIDPDDFLALVAGGDVELLNGAMKEAEEYYERSVSIAGTTGESAFKLAFVLHKLGQKKKAEILATENLSAYATDPDRYPEGSQVPYYVAALYAWRGDNDQASRWLEQAITLGYRDYRWISVDPQLEDLRSTAQYRDIMSSLRSTHEEMRENALREMREGGE
jgi:TolB-like protein/Flp pilus assembly protein TadD